MSEKWTDHPRCEECGNLSFDGPCQACAAEDRPAKEKQRERDLMVRLKTVEEHERAGMIQDQSHLALLDHIAAALQRSKSHD